MREKMNVSYDGGRAKQPLETNHVEIRKRKKETSRRHRRKAKEVLDNIDDLDELLVEQKQLTGWDIW